ncbi:hypothetical protein E2P81_ATG03886 [Venturia nashicola]|uniref:Uncharacterized protein n=1 Tax=Venturia nashicola TaxID=86259 RepID=A0A4Z1PTE9_9PEZI|nr:hypothetical protein E6O75_ATG03977 [Venturia nashicola]TLD38211.1 hypothetical protein E2P81_ATG03886 [Venturia nashicola]
MDASSLQILHLLLSIFQVLALGSPNAIITSLQHLSAVLICVIFEYFSLNYPRNTHFRHSKIPNLWRLFLSLLCLASLAYLGSSNSIICLFRSLFSWLLAGIGGIDAWSFECPKELRGRKTPGASPSTNPVSTPNTSQAVDQIGYLRLNPGQIEDYNAHCDFVEGLQTAIRKRDTTISRLEAGIKHRDIAISRQQSKLDKQKIELEIWRKHRCPVPGFGQPSVGILLHRIASLEDSLNRSRGANTILHEQLQKSHYQSGFTPSETDQASNSSQQARVASAFFETQSLPPPMLVGTTNAVDTYAHYQAHTVSGIGLSAINLPPMVTGTIDISSQPPQANPDPAPPSISAAVRDTPSASAETADPPSEPPTSQPKPTAPSGPGRKIKSVKHRVAREMRSDNNDLDDADIDWTYIPPKIIDFTCICEGMSNTNIQLQADVVFGDLGDAWLNRKKDAVKGRGLEKMEYWGHFMELDRSAQIQSNALMLMEEKGVVHMTLKE